MEPLTTTLIATIAATAGTLAGGVGAAAGEELWARITAKLAAWRRLDERTRTAAFATAVQRARQEFRNATQDDPDAAYVLSLLGAEHPEWRIFRQMAVEELLFSATPDMGRLLDYYRRHLRWLALVRNEDPPAWTVVARHLRLFLAHLLPRALADQPALRPLLLEQAELQTLDAARRTAAATEAGADTLARIETLLRELLTGPRYLQQISAEEGSRIAGVQQIMAHYYAAEERPPPDLDALFRRYRSFLRETYGTLNVRGILQVQNVVTLPLEEVYVPLTGTAAADHRMQRKDAERGAPDAPRSSGGDDLYATLGAPGSSIRSLHTLVRDTPFLVVLGDPGAGKVRRMTARVIVRNAPQVGAMTCEVNRLTGGGNTKGNTACR